MEPFQQELELLSNLCLREPALTVDVPEGVQVEMLNDVQATAGGWRLADLAWGAEAWALLRVTVPSAAMPALGERMTAHTSVHACTATLWNLDTDPAPS